MCAVRHVMRLRRCLYQLPRRKRIFIKEPVMFEKDYVLVKIEGDYAYLHDESGACAEDLFIALALLPEGCDIGTRLHYENFAYEII